MYLSSEFHTGKTFGFMNCGSVPELKTVWSTFQYTTLLPVFEDGCVEQAMYFTTGCDSMSSFSGIWNQEIFERVGGLNGVIALAVIFLFQFSWLTVKFKSFWHVWRLTFIKRKSKSVSKCYHKTCELLPFHFTNLFVLKWIDDFFQWKG